jgi:hypothetical protein
MMKMTVVRRLLAASACSLPALVAAQPPPAGPPPPPDSLFFVTSSAPLKLDVLGAEGLVPGGVVKDKPYAADSITESTQVLADGNRITHRNQARVYRDSQGRTRREQAVGSLGVFQAPSDPITLVTIHDPVAEVTYFLDPGARTARKLQPFRLELGGRATFERALPPAGDGNATFVAGVAAGPLQAPFPPPPSLESGAPADGAIAIRSTGPGVAAFGPATAAVAPFGAADSSTEDLGEQVLEGVLAHGTRDTATIPAGTLGNERPIAITSERWYSAEIEAVVSSKTSDPRFGETSYTLVNLVRAEPAADLFVIPSGYELQADADSPRAGARTLGPGDAPPPGGRVERRVFLVEPTPPKSDK